MIRRILWKQCDPHVLQARIEQFYDMNPRYLVRGVTQHLDHPRYAAVTAIYDTEAEAEAVFESGVPDLALTV